MSALHIPQTKADTIDALFDSGRGAGLDSETDELQAVLLLLPIEQRVAAKVPEMASNQRLKASAPSAAADLALRVRPPASIESIENIVSSEVSLLSPSSAHDAAPGTNVPGSTSGEACHPRVTYFRGRKPIPLADSKVEHDPERFLGKSTLLEMRNAYLYADSMQLPLNTMLTITWRSASGFVAKHWTANKRVEERVMHSLSTFFGERGLPLAYVWAMENPKKGG